VEDRGKMPLKNKMLTDANGKDVVEDGGNLDYW